MLNFMRRNLISLVSVFLGFGMAAGANVNLQVWAPVALVRIFHETPGLVGVRLGMVTLAYSFIGVFASGLIARRLRPRFGERVLPQIAQGAVAIALVLLPGYLMVRSAWQVYGLSLAVGSAMIAAISLSPTLLQRIAPDRFRSRLIALGGLTYVVLLSVTPVVVGRLSDTVFHSQRGLLSAMIVVSITCIAAAIVLLGLARAKLDATLAEVDALDAQA